MGNVNYNETTTASVLSMVKINLGISTTAYDAAITDNIAYARSCLEDLGLTLDETSTSDAMLTAMYATWLWCERETGQKMPRMLETAINNKFAHQVMADTANGS